MVKFFRRAKRDLKVLVFHLLNIKSPSLKVVAGWQGTEYEWWKLPPAQRQETIDNHARETSNRYLDYLDALMDALIEEQIKEI